MSPLGDPPEGVHAIVWVAACDVVEDAWRAFTLRQRELMLRMAAYPDPAQHASFDFGSFPRPRQRDLALATILVAEINGAIVQLIQRRMDAIFSRPSLPGPLTR